MNLAPRGIDMGQIQTPWMNAATPPRASSTSMGLALTPQRTSRPPKAPGVPMLNGMQMMMVLRPPLLRPPPEQPQPRGVMEIPQWTMGPVPFNGLFPFRLQHPRHAHGPRRILTITCLVEQIN